MKGYIHSFESFGTVDGPGIRFVIFMQGCILRCLYCHNPDTWKLNSGKQYEVEDVMKEVRKYKNYIRDGGVTITGGEPLLQLDFVNELFRTLKEEKIHTCLDTSGILFDESNDELMKKLDDLIEVCDLFMLDLKHIDPKEHITLTGMSNEPILKFAHWLSDHHKKMWIRHVLVPNITTDEQYLLRLREYLDTLKTIEKVEVLPYHRMGIAKYENLGIDYPLIDTIEPTKDEIQIARSILCDVKERNGE